MGHREHGLTTRQISRARTARRRYQGGQAVRLEDRRVELVDGFLVGMREMVRIFWIRRIASACSWCMTGRRRLDVLHWRIWV